jgi:plasmid stabilization system protein ParE
MNRTLVVSTRTEADLAEAVAWYDRLQPGLGDDFVRCVERALDRILDHPHAFATNSHDVRRALVRRFPYGLFFRVRQQRIEVEALFPLRSDPARLRERLGSRPECDS